MSISDNTVKMIRYYTSHKKDPVIDFAGFASFVQKYAGKYKQEHKELELFSENPYLVLSAELEALNKEGRLTLEYEGGKITKIIYWEYFLLAVKELYRELERNQELPFPAEESLGRKIPENLITRIEVKSDFVDILKSGEMAAARIIRLVFPEGIREMLIVSDLIKGRLLDYSVIKIRSYLRIQRNANYIYNKLYGIFGQKDMALKDTITSILDKPLQTAQSMLSPTDFSFRFWTTLANLIIQEYKTKTNKLAEEHSYCQAAYLIGFYNVYYKDLIQGERESQAALKHLERSFKKPPYAFTLTDITNFKDAQGIPLLKKYSLNTLHKYLEEKTHSEASHALPEIIRFKVPDNREYFIHKDFLLPLTLKKINDASVEYRKVYVEEWSNELKDYKKTEAMVNDSAFDLDIENRLKAKDPLLITLLNFDLLYVLKEEVNTNYQVGNEINRILDQKKRALIPFSELLKLNRGEILTAAKLQLPFLESLPLLGALVVFVKRLMRNLRKRTQVGREIGTSTKKSVAVVKETSGRKGSGSSAKAGGMEDTLKKTGTGSERAKSSLQLQEFRKRVSSLKNHFVGDKNIDRSLSELADRWNPLFDPQSRANLTEDVNAFIRDFLRKMRRGIIAKPPDIDGLQNMAVKLSNNPAFNQIKSKDNLRRYIEMYIIKILSKQ
ncbi:MAG: hypothetical protein AB1798_20975 [Spirochaetota bacterium]